MKRICVYCGSSQGNNPAFVSAAAEFGRLLSSRQIGLVYGGSQRGLMGAVSAAVKASGGEVIGVIPRGLCRKEVVDENLTELHVVDTMHERKAMMEQLSDGFVALPGGFGTFEEILEIITWAQLGLHHKPCAFLNVDGYYDSIVALFDGAVSSELIQPVYRHMVLFGHQPESLLERMFAYEPPKVEQVLWQSDI